MKKIIKALCLAGFFLLTMVTSCNIFKEPQRCCITIYNKSGNSINCYIAIGVKLGICYPDSLPDSLPDLISISGLNDHSCREGCGYDYGVNTDLLKNCSSDTISIYIFHTDTLKKYSWKEIKQGYKILKRFDLSLKDLERMEYKVIYR